MLKIKLFFFFYFESGSSSALEDFTGDSEVEEVGGGVDPFNWGFNNTTKKVILSPPIPWDDLGSSARHVFKTFLVISSRESPWFNPSFTKSHYRKH